MPSVHASALGTASPGAWSRTTLPVLVATVLLMLGLVNIVQRATVDDVEDGVLWVQRSTGVVAADVDPRSPAGRAGVRAGDILLAIADGVIDQSHIRGELGERPSRKSPTECTFFKSLGLAVEDVASASYVYAKAIAAGIGTQFSL